MSELEIFIRDSKKFRGETYQPKANNNWLKYYLVFFIIFVTSCAVIGKAQTQENKKQQNTEERK